MQNVAHVQIETSCKIQKEKCFKTFVVGGTGGGLYFLLLPEPCTPRFLPLRALCIAKYYACCQIFPFPISWFLPPWESRLLYNSPPPIVPPSTYFFCTGKSVCGLKKKSKKKYILPEQDFAPFTHLLNLFFFFLFVFFHLELVVKL